MNIALRFLKTKLRHNQYDRKRNSKIKISPSKSKSKPDIFIKKYLKNYHSTNNVPDSVLMDMRRVVFVSLKGLYKTWKKCPIHVLYTSILLLPLKRDWIRNPTKHKTELTPSLVFIYIFFYFFDGLVQCF